MAREQSLIAEAKETLARLDAETGSLANTARLAADFEQKALVAFDEAESTLKSRRGAPELADDGTAEARARRQTLEKQKAERPSRSPSCSAS